MNVVRRTHTVGRVPSIAEVETYLLSKGWRKVAGQNAKILIYHGPNDVEGNPIVVVLPARADLLDAKQRLKDVIRTVSILEATPYNDLVKLMRLDRNDRSATRTGAMSVKPKKIPYKAAGA